MNGTMSSLGRQMGMVKFTPRQAPMGLDTRAARIVLSDPIFSSGANGRGT